MTRLKRITLSSTVALVLYWTYALLAVPLIEPEAERPHSDKPRGQVPVTRRSAERKMTREYAVWFPPEAWERADPIVVEFAQGRLLLQNYKNHQDGRVELNPCTMVFLPKVPTADSDDWIREAVILQAPQGADLQFDKTFDPFREGMNGGNGIGRLVAGQLPGPITIRSDYKESGPADDLQIFARDAVLFKEQITSDHAVDFRLGENHGSGQGLLIQLAPRDPTENQKEQVLGVSGIRSIALTRDVEMSLETESLQSDRDPPAQNADDKQRDTKSDPRRGSELLAETPLLIRSQGPFEFNLEEQVATFDENVDVVRTNPNGSADTLRGDHVAVYFAASGEEVGPADRPRDLKNSQKQLGKLEPTRLEVRGSPVVVSSPDRDVEARGQLLTYDLRTGQASLTGNEVRLRRGNDEIRAPAVHFRPGANGGWATFSATGPGSLRAIAPDRGELSINATWRDQLRFAPYEGSPVLTLFGSAFVEVEGRGRLNAEKIYLWLREQPKSSDIELREDEESSMPRLEPDRLLAEETVNFDLAQLHGQVQRLEAWFVADASLPTASAGSYPSNENTFNARPGQHRGAPEPWRAEAVVGGNPGSTAESPGSEFHLAAGLLQVELVAAGETADITGLVLENDVHVVEKPLGPLNRQPLELKGSSIKMLGSATEGRQQITIEGAPATIEGASLALTGRHVFVDRATSQMHVEGAGTMTLPVDRDFEGRPVARPVPLEVSWQKRMDFDGLTARFEERVVTRLEQRTMRTEVMDVAFAEKLDLSGSRGESGAARPDVALVRCHGDVYLESTTFEQSQRVSIERLLARDLTIDQVTGRIDGMGPGRLTRVSLGTRNDFLAPRDPAKPKQVRPPDQAAQPPKSELSFLGVDFAGRLDGNLHRRAMAFHDDVNAVYGPVEQWGDTIELDAFDESGESGVLLHCERLAVSELDVPPQKGIELEATGDPTVEGREFYARGGRMRYTQAKDLVVLEGLGRTKAELWHQKAVGAAGSHWVARKILYWRRSGQVSVDDAERMDLLSVGRPH